MPNLEQWHDMWRGLGVTNGNVPLFYELLGRYSEAHRSYHTAQHLDECLAWIPHVQPLAHHPHEIALALWFHDVIYDAKRQDNELRSAEWAKAEVLRAGLPDDSANRVYELVMVTRHSAVPVETDAKILVDIDLSILGALTERFDEYERQVRSEYAWVPEDLFRQTRKKILQEFLARPRIFNMAYFFDRYEISARANLQRSINALRT